MPDGNDLKRISALLAKGQPVADDDLKVAWDASTDARDVLAVAVALLGENDSGVAFAACACARAALVAARLVSPELSSALETTERWAAGSASAVELKRAHDTAYSQYHLAPADPSFDGEARASAMAAVMGATNGAGPEVAMDAANAIACASDPLDRDEMRDRRTLALRDLAELIRARLPCPTSKQ